MVATISGEALNIVFETIGSDGTFSAEQHKVLSTLGARRNAVLLAFPPKAAGTFLRTAVIEAAFGQLVRVVHAQGGRDAQLYLPTFIGYFCGGVTDYTLVAHVHLLALPANLRFLSAFGIRPIVMVRNIPDALASYWDMLERDDSALLDGLNCHIPDNFRQMPREAKGDFITDILGPWYANFYAGWFKHAATDSSVCLVRYSEFRDRPQEILQSILKHVGLPADPETCDRALQYAWTERYKHRFNEGVEGRGQSYFTAPQLERLSRMLDYYPELGPRKSELLQPASKIEPYS
jgi:hypothetical protein